MSEHRPHDEHTSFIKTPKQLLVVVILAFLVPILLISIIASLATHSVEPSAKVASDAAIAKRLKPVGQVVVAEGSDTPGERTGKQVVEAVCSACHATGALNAPKIGDAGAWGPLIKDGHAHLTEMAIKGVRQMPPKGGNPQLTDDEVARAVAFMANQAGASFKEPPVQAAPVQVAAAPGAPAAAGASVVPTAAAAAPAGATSGAAAGGASNGKAIFEANCVACHGTGVAGAPKIGDKAAWAPRLKQGMDTLHQSALKGKGAMPPKGGNMALPDADVMAAVDYLAGQGK
ncbi:MAG: cytochrome c5 family protein [Betaproteobacteria bacterium]|jgi:cytochrome c5|nr:cytochrome c5 family protein [Betaproteobacteria bacterium]